MRPDRNIFRQRRRSVEAVLFEDQVKYDRWIQVLLAFSVLVLVAIGFLLYTDAYSRDVLPSETAKESGIGALILFGAAVFEALLFWAILPRKIFICQKRVRIKYGLFYYNIPFDNIRSASAAKGIALGSYVSSLTSFKNQVEIVRTKGLRIRFSPARVDLFLEALERALADWRRMEQEVKIH